MYIYIYIHNYINPGLNNELAYNNKSMNIYISKSNKSILTIILSLCKYRSARHCVSMTLLIPLRRSSCGVRNQYRIQLSIIYLY